VLKPFVGEAIISTDVAVLGIHLDAELFSLGDLGYKAVTSALSDLAAMGARPRGLVLAVSAPPGTDLEEIHAGAAEAALPPPARHRGGRSLGRTRRHGRGDGLW
jgi:thiamine-monophosphate kinase